MANIKKLDDTLQMRVNSEELKEFTEKCESLVKPYQQVIREFLTAFNEGRLTIQLTDEQVKAHKDLHNVD